jgi:hypothetical protein
MSDDNISHLMLEQFRLIRTQIDRVYEEVRALKVDMLSLRHSGRSRDLILDQDHDDVAALKVRVDRIERRLELTDQ